MSLIESDVERASTLAVANWFVGRALEDGHDLTLQALLKLVYFAHGWHLGIKGTPLLSSAVEALEFGPIPIVAYRAFRHERNGPIRTMASAAESTLIPQVRCATTQAFLEHVWAHYGRLDGKVLSAMASRAGTPWVQARRMGVRVISEASLQRYFRELLGRDAFGAAFAEAGVSAALAPAALPPRPPRKPPHVEGQAEGERTLPRYGLHWRDASSPVSVPMPDGYWTPWHLAHEQIQQLAHRCQVAETSLATKDEQLAELRRQLDQAREHAGQWADIAGEHGAQVDTLRAAIAQLAQRLEVSDQHPIDGIDARDATIRLLEQDRQALQLEVQARTQAEDSERSRALDLAMMVRRLAHALQKGGERAHANDLAAKAMALLARNDQLMGTPWRNEASTTAAAPEQQSE